MWVYLAKIDIKIVCQSTNSADKLKSSAKDNQETKKKMSVCFNPLLTAISFVEQSCVYSLIFVSKSTTTIQYLKISD